MWFQVSTLGAVGGSLLIAWTLKGRVKDQTRYGIAMIPYVLLALYSIYQLLF